MPLRVLTLLIPAALLLAASVLLLVAPGVVGWSVLAVPSGNMERTLPVGSYAAARPAEVGRGDIVVHEGSFGVEGAAFVHRVVAVGGETIECCDSGATVVDGDPINEPYVFEADERPFGPVTVPDGRLFVMGDHRTASRDSRAYLDDVVAATVARSSVRGVVDGPDSRWVAHLRPWLHFAPHLLVVALGAALATELLVRRRLGPASRSRPASG